jgi:hypothetical protein
MLTVGDLLDEEWEIRRFHAWYMHYTTTQN